MNIHEYQARELFQKFGVATSRSGVASSPKEVESVAKAARRLVSDGEGTNPRGRRGKGHFSNGFKGGVHLCKTPAEAAEIAAKMLGNALITHQTGAEGRVVNKVLIAEAIDIEEGIVFRHRARPGQWRAAYYCQHGGRDGHRDCRGGQCQRNSCGSR